MAGMFGLCRRGFASTRPLYMAMSTPGGLPANGFRNAQGAKVDTGLTGISANEMARAELIGEGGRLLLLRVVLLPPVPLPCLLLRLRPLHCRRHRPRRRLLAPCLSVPWEAPGGRGLSPLPPLPPLLLFLLFLLPPPSSSSLLPPDPARLGGAVIPGRSHLWRVCVCCAALNTELLAQAGALPTTAVYRTSVESTAEHALSVLQSNASDADVEATLGLGQLEEQVLAAKDELNLMAQMSEWKPWEGGPSRHVLFCVPLCTSVPLCVPLPSVCVCVCGGGGGGGGPPPPPPPPPAASALARPPWVGA
eukprot:COSAG03_NODE_1366_length_4248_cov_171.653651_1_plen_305_part_10